MIAQYPALSWQLQPKKKRIKKMKLKSTMVAALVTLLVAGNSLAMMGGGGGGMGGGGMGGHGYGMNGAGGMMTGMLGRTMRNGYLDVLAPIATTQDAITAFQNFISSAKSDLQVSEVWEYQTVYKAELSDSKGHKAFDVLADKLTGAVTPEMGFSMMMNASWGRMLQKTPVFGSKLVLSADDATAAAQAFVSKNVAIINYNLTAPETYPGYYKIHTTDTSGKPGMDIMVNGYNGRIWMNTLLGAPLSQVYQAP
jgi:hypothetical protein